MHFWKILQYGTRTNKLSGKRYRQFSILEKSHFSLCPGSGPKGSNAKWCLPGQEMEEDSALPHAWGQQELVASKGWGRRCHGQGSSRGARAPGPLREELLLPPNLARVRKLRFRDCLLFLSRDQGFFSSLDIWLALIWFSFWKDSKKSWLPNK